MRFFLCSSAGRILLAAVLTLALCTLWLHVLAHSLAWMLLTLGGFFLVMAACAGRWWLQWPALALMSLCTVLFVAELFLTGQNLSARAVRTYNGQTRPIMMHPDPLLGFGSVPKAQQIRTAKTVDGKPVYDVLHSTDEAGRRISPQHPEAQKAVLFFGCSFTAGVGVNDAEVYPHVVGTLLGRSHQVFNLGVGGYGPHQFLALLQSDRLEDIFRRYPEAEVFFMSIAAHERRSGGLAEWDTQGPRYVLQEGRAVRQGSFADAAVLGERFDAAWKRSALVRDVLVEKMQWRKAELLALQQAIFVEAQRTLQARHPRAAMTVLLTPDAAYLAPAYRAAGLRVLDLTPALPGWPDPARYEIPNDRHPTPLAHSLMAKAVVRQIQGETGR